MTPDQRSPRHPADLDQSDTVVKFMHIQLLGEIISLVLIFSLLLSSTVGCGSGL